MKIVHRFLVLAALLSISFIGTMSAQNAFLETDLVANSKPLIDSNGIVHTPLQVDPHLLNPWGVGESGGVGGLGVGASRIEHRRAGTDGAANALERCDRVGAAA